MFRADRTTEKMLLAYRIYLPVIRQVIDKRPTYGYKRVTALVNRILRGFHRKEINRKRVYRLMKMHGLILPKSGEKREESRALEREYKEMG